MISSDRLLRIAQDATGGIVYSNLDDERAGVHQITPEYYREVLANLDVPVPESLFIAVARDQLERAGNRQVVHILTRTNEF